MVVSTTCIVILLSFDFRFIKVFWHNSNKDASKQGSGNIKDRLGPGPQPSPPMSTSSSTAASDNTVSLIFRIPFVQVTTVHRHLKSKRNLIKNYLSLQFITTNTTLKKQMPSEAIKKDAITVLEDKKAKVRIELSFLVALLD